ncbi:hypothetical protein [Cylindrospermopsis raciborskii]|nr:hypothetical protein [Cylindrospermopsis raciborskii]
MKMCGGAITRSEGSPINFPASSQGKIMEWSTGLSPIVTAVRSHFP